MVVRGRSVGLSLIVPSQMWSRPNAAARVGSAPPAPCLDRSGETSGPEGLYASIEKEDRWQT